MTYCLFFYFIFVFFLEESEERNLREEKICRRIVWSDTMLELWSNTRFMWFSNVSTSKVGFFPPFFIQHTRVYIDRYIYTHIHTHAYKKAECTTPLIIHKGLNKSYYTISNSLHYIRSSMLITCHMPCIVITNQYRDTRHY